MTRELHQGAARIPAAFGFAIQQPGSPDAASDSDWAASPACFPSVTPPAPPFAEQERTEPTLAPTPDPTPGALILRSRASVAPGPAVDVPSIYDLPTGPGVTRGSVFAIVSMAAHFALLGAVVLGGHAAASPPKDDLIDVSVEPALGQPHGSPEGKGLGSHIESFTPPPQYAPRHAAPVHEKTDPDGVPSPTASASASAAPATSAPVPDSSAAASATPPDGPPGDPSTPAGSANVAPGIGRPDGSEDGQGTAPPKPKMTAAYKGLLAGWFGARFNVRGLGIPDDELRKLSASVSISISEDRRVVGFALARASGNAAYDEEVRRTVAGIQASGVPLPEPPDGSTPPPSFTINFRPQVIR